MSMAAPPRDGITSVAADPTHVDAGCGAGFHGDPNAFKTSGPRGSRLRCAGAPKLECSSLFRSHSAVPSLPPAALRHRCRMGLRQTRRLGDLVHRWRRVHLARSM
jgi:hypothetical protein